jgi:homogentisate 1,2-dioxygenase
MANPRDFRAPTAAYDHDFDRPVEVIHKLGGNLWRADYDHSPLDVVAWHGNSVPYVYNLRHFQVMGSVNFDHADPSRFTVLTSPTAIPGLGNIDFCVAPPEWAATEDTMRLQYFHRNVSAEFYGVVREWANPGGWRQGIAGLVNMLVPHGPNAASWKAASTAELGPMKTGEDYLIVVGETQWPISLTTQAHQSIGITDDETLSGNNTLQSNFHAPGPATHDGGRNG